MRNGLVKRRVVDKNGKHTTVWVRQHNKPNNPSPKKKGDVLKEIHDWIPEYIRTSDEFVADSDNEDKYQAYIQAKEKREEFKKIVIEKYVTGELTKEQIESDSAVAKIANINYKKYVDVGDKTVYHFTVNANAVLSEGFKVKDDLKQEGVGGGDGISLTYDVGYADTLMYAFTKMKNALTGRSSMQSDYEELERVNPEGAKSLIDHLKSSRGGSVEQIMQAIETAEEYSYDGYDRSFTITPDKFVKDFYNAYFMFHPDEEYLALFSSIDHLPDADLGVLKMKLKPKAKAEHLPAEREYRVDTPNVIDEATIERMS